MSHKGKKKAIKELDNLEQIQYRIDKCGLMFKPEKIELTNCIIPERPPTLCDNGMALLIHKTVTQKQRRKRAEIRNF